MKSFKKIFTTYILIISVLLSLIPVNVVYGETVTNIFVESYENGILTVTWPYIEEDIGSILVYSESELIQEKIINSPTTNSITLEGFENNIVYDIVFEFYSDLNGDGFLVNEGFLYFMPKMSFYAEVINQEKKEMNGGGYQIGIEPKINLKWKVPKVWDNDMGEMVYLEEGMIYMQNKLNEYYMNKELFDIDFKINISKDIDNLISGSTEASVLVKYDFTSFTASVINNPDLSILVRDRDENGYLNFDLIGRRDESSDLPESEEYGLPDSDILPGSVYYMSIKPQFRNFMNEYVNVLRIGSPSNQNGSILAGGVEYTYTPLRYELTRDGAGNVYVKIYKLNKGSLNLPRLFYEVQISDDNTIQGDWIVKRTIDNSYFNDEYALAVISGINPYNKTYYKIVIKSDNEIDRLESSQMDYVIADDSSRPPLPTGIKIVDRELVEGFVDGEIVKTTNVTLAWDKPINWEEIKSNTDPEDDIVYHINLNTTQLDEISEFPPELTAEGNSYGRFQNTYRKIKYISSKNLVDTGTSLEYTLNGLELFSGEFVDYDGEIYEEEIDNEPNEENEYYPTYLLPNKEYYIQIYTTRGRDRFSDENEDMSDKSLAVSFTTLSSSEKEIPVPGSFSVVNNDVEVEFDENTNEVIDIINSVELSLNKLSDEIKDTLLDSNEDKVYFDIYMSNRTEIDGFELIGSTEFVDNDIIFTGIEGENKNIRALISKFSESSSSYDLFGEKLLPNSTYYFVVKTRVEYVESGEYRESKFSKVLTVTTLKGSIEKPNPDTIIPKAPIDFNLSKDKSGNYLLNDTGATFEWLNRESDVEYQIIATSKIVNQYDEEISYEDDLTYLSFVNYFDGDIFLDPQEEKDGMLYDKLNKKVYFEISEWIFPNKLYYFSIRAINKDTGNVSSWVSIPITTLAIEPPDDIEAVSNCEINFNWIYDDELIIADDFDIYISSDDSEEILVNRANNYIVREGSNYYAKIFNIVEFNSVYNIYVYYEDDLIHSESDIFTRKNTNEIDVRWTGNEGHEYEVVVKPANSSEYVLLTEEDYEVFLNKSSNELNTNSYKFNIRISYIETKMPDGSLEHLPLKSNMKYYVKVRTVKNDPLDYTIFSYSKYMGPVTARTEFSQDEYDRSKLEEFKINKFDLLIKESVEKKIYWEADLNDGVNRYFLKSDRLINNIRNDSKYLITIDLSEMGEFSFGDYIYMPVDVFEELEKNGVGLKLILNDSTYTLRPETIGVNINNEIDYIKNDVDVEGVYLKIIIENDLMYEEDIPYGYVEAADAYYFTIDVIGSPKSSSEYDKQLDYKFNFIDGITIEEYKILLLNEIKRTKIEEFDLIDEYIDELYNELKIELSTYLTDDIFENIEELGNNSEILEFNKPLIVKINYENLEGKEVPFVKYYDLEDWKILKTGVVYFEDYMLYNTKKVGQYSVISSAVEDGGGNLNKNEQLEFSKIISKYDIADVFKTSYYSNPNDNLIIDEVLGIYEKVNNISSETTLNEKVNKYNIQKIFGEALRTENGYITREQGAFILAKIYSEKIGMNVDMLRAKRLVFIEDEDNINKQMYNQVMWCLDINIFDVFDEKFRPKEFLTRKDFVKLLRKILDVLDED